MVELSFTTKLVILFLGFIAAVGGAFMISSFRKLSKLFVGAILLGAGIMSMLIGFGILKFGF